MSCKRYRLWLSQLVDGELGPEERRLLGDHLPRCQACRSESEANHRLSLTLQAWTAPTTSEELPPSLRQRLREELAAGRSAALPSPLWRRPLARAALGLAVAGLLVPVVVGGLDRSPATREAEAPAAVAPAPSVSAGEAHAVRYAARALRTVAAAEFQQRLSRAAMVVQECLQQPPEAGASAPRLGPSGDSLRTPPEEPSMDLPRVEDPQREEVGI